MLMESTMRLEFGGYNYCLNEVLRVVIHLLLEKTIAKDETEKIQEAVNSLVVFFREEANRLKKAKKKSGFEGDFLGQKERDRMFIHARFC